MVYTTLDKIIRGYLLQRRYPMHFYLEFLVYAQRCFEEIHFDTLGNVRTQRLFINPANQTATLPADFMAEIKVGLENGQFIKPMVHRPGYNRINNYTYEGIIATFGTLTGGAGYTDGTYSNVPLTGGTGLGATANITILSGTATTVVLVNGGTHYSPGDLLSATSIGGTGTGFSIQVATNTDSGVILYPDSENLFSAIKAGYAGYLRYNDHLEFTGRLFGAAVDRTDSYKIIKERGIIQLHNDIDADAIVLEYISDGSEIDNATQITPYAKSTFEAYIKWQYMENSRSHSESQRIRARDEFQYQYTILRARMNPLTITDIKGMYYRNSLGSPK